MHAARSYLFVAAVSIVGAMIGQRQCVKIVTECDASAIIGAMPGYARSEENAHAGMLGCCARDRQQ